MALQGEAKGATLTIDDFSTVQNGVTTQEQVLELINAGIVTNSNPLVTATDIDDNMNTVNTIGGSRRLNLQVLNQTTTFNRATSLSVGAGILSLSTANQLESLASVT